MKNSKGNATKEIKNKVYSRIADLSVKTISAADGGMACFFILHQPEVPKELRRKYSDARK